MSGDDVTTSGGEDADIVKLSQLRQEHRKLDAEIEALQLQGDAEMKLMTMKRRKLQLKDEIAWLMTKTTPDIIA